MTSNPGTMMNRGVPNLRTAGIAVLLALPACGNGTQHGGAGPDSGPVATYGGHGSIGGGSSNGNGSFGSGSAAGGTSLSGAGGAHSSTSGIPNPTDGGGEAHAFSQPFAALVSQEVPWSDLSVRLIGARVERDSDPHSYSASQIYADLDLAITNHGQDEVDYSDRDTWDLILAGGTRVRSENSLGLMISPTDTANTTLRYPVVAGTTLVGGLLELNGSDRGKVEPERVPLDSTWEQKYPLEIDSLRGGQLRQPEPSNSWLELIILDGRVDLNDREGRAPLGMKFVHLDMKANTTGSYQNVLDSFFRIIVNGSSAAPVNDVNLLVPGDTSTTFEVLFTVPSNTTRFEIQIMPRNDMSIRLPVDLSKDAHLGVSDRNAGASDAGH